MTDLRFVVVWHHGQQGILGLSSWNSHDNLQGLICHKTQPTIPTYIIYIYICIFRQHFFVNANFIEHNTHFMPTYSLLDPFEFPYYFYRIRGELIKVLSIVVCIPSKKKTKKHSCPTTQLRKILTDNTTILEHQNNKQKLQILEALYIRNLQPALNRINFQTSANVLKCL